MFSLDEARALHAHDHTASPAAVADVRLGIAGVLLARGEATLDATSTRAEHRREWLALAERYQARVTAQVIRVPLELALERNAARKRPVPRDVVIRMWEEVAALTPKQLRAEGFAEVTNCVRSAKAAGACSARGGRTNPITSSPPAPGLSTPCPPLHEKEHRHHGPTPR